MTISTRIRTLLEIRSLYRPPRVSAGKRGWGTWLVVAALAAIGVAATVDVLRGEEEEAPSADRQAATGAKANTAEEPPTRAGSDDLIESPFGRRHAVIEEGVRFSFRTPQHGLGWERFSSISTDKSAGGPISVNKSIVGAQGAEAIVYWTSFPHGDYADMCPRLLSSSVGPSAAALAAAVSTAPGTKLVTGPSDVTVGRRAAKHVVLTVRENLGCDPGFFYTWREVQGGVLWTRTGVGDTIRVWVVEVDGTRLFIAAQTTEAATNGLEKEIQQIIRSIRFD
jgi:hypothetical protein